MQARDTCDTWTYMPMWMGDPSLFTFGGMRAKTRQDSRFSNATSREGKAKGNRISNISPVCCFSSVFVFVLHIFFFFGKAQPRKKRKKCRQRKTCPGARNLRIRTIDVSSIGDRTAQAATKLPVRHTSVIKWNTMCAAQNTPEAEAKQAENTAATTNPVTNSSS